MEFFKCRLFRGVILYFGMVVLIFVWVRFIVFFILLYLLKFEKLFFEIFFLIIGIL